MATKEWLGDDAGHEGEVGWAANYEPAGVPTHGDDLWFRESSQDADEQLGALIGVHLRSIRIEQSYTGLIGTAEAYLETMADEVHIGRHDGPGSPAGSPRIKLDLFGGSGSLFSGSFGAKPKVYVYDTATNPQEANLPPVRLLVDDPDAELHVRKGRVGVAVEPGEASVLGTLRMSWESSVEGDAEVIVGEGVAGLALVDKQGGSLILRCGAVLVRNWAGELVTQGSGAIPSLYAEGGKLWPESSGLITGLYAYGGNVDFTRSGIARNVTNLQVDPRNPGSIAYDPAVLTIANILTLRPIKLSFEEA